MWDMLAADTRMHHSTVFLMGGQDIAHSGSTGLKLQMLAYCYISMKVKKDVAALTEKSNEAIEADRRGFGRARDQSVPMTFRNEMSFALTNKTVWFGLLEI
jgi:hypothetical protein